MDFNKLYQDLHNKKYTDVELILVDCNKQLIMNVHKVILACSSEYFDKLFNFGTEKFQHQIIINVNDVDVAHDIILSFYGQKTNSTNYPLWKYLLESMKCRCFFCLPSDISLLYNLIVPAEGFDLLLEIIEHFDFINDNKIMRTIKKNIPMNYDLRNLSLEFVKELSKFQDLKKIVSGSDDNSIKIWDADSGSLLNTLNGHTNSVYSVAFSSDNRKIVSGSGDYSIKIWDAESGSLLNTLNGHTDWIQSVAFSSDNHKIVSGSDDKSIKIWDADSGSLLNTLNGHTNLINSVAFSSDNRKIVSGSSDKSIKIWDADSGSLLKTLNGHTEFVWCVAFSNPVVNDINKKLNDFLSSYDHSSID